MSAVSAVEAKRSHPLAMFFAWFAIVFIVLFPKGGIKAIGIPITWGYLGVGLTAPIFLLVRLTQMSLRIPMRVVAALAMLVPFQSLFAYAGVAYGVVNIGYAAANVTSLFVFPVVFLFIYPPFLGYIDGVRLSTYLRWSVLIAACWGLFLFFWKPFTGNFIEIPYLTVNAADYGQLETTKHIARGFFTKLISTYNNGNLYGVSTLILLPLYQVLEKSRVRKALVIAALLLTLSRSVWAGLVIAEALPLVEILLLQIKTFPVLYLGKALKSVIAIAITVGLVFVALLFNVGQGIEFLFDPTVGGRVGELTGFAAASLVPNQALTNFDEIVYASAAERLGWLGFLSLALVMISPLLLLLVDSSALRSPTRRAALQGLVIYSILAWVDGAIQLIPVMAFYWFTYMIFLFGWPNELQTLEAAKPKPSRLRAKLPRVRWGISQTASSTQVS